MKKGYTGYIAKYSSIFFPATFLSYIFYCLWYFHNTTLWRWNCLSTAPTLILRVTSIPLLANINFSSNHYMMIFNCIYKYNVLFSVPEVTGRQLWGIHTCSAQDKQWQVFHRGNRNGKTIFRREGFPFEQVHFVLL